MISLYSKITRVMAQRRRILSLIMFGGLMCVCLCIYALTYAQDINTYRDTISTSAPGAYANHTIEFKVTMAIPPGGYIRVRPGDGDFVIPPSSFGIYQTELYVAHPAGAYVLRSATSTADATHDGVAITYGSGDIAFTLNSSTGIAAGDSIRILLGNSTQNSTTTDTGIKNPTATGSQPIYIAIGGGGGKDESVRTWIAIVDQVGVGPIAVHKTPPFRFDGAPSGALTGLVTAAQLSLQTDEFSRCRYSQASGTSFYAMSDEFSSTNSIFHNTIIRGLLPATTYTYYVRCMDNYESRINTDDYSISFTVNPLPTGTPGTGTDNSTSGTGVGGGSGSSGAGGGSSSGNAGGSATGSGGDRGGGAGGGGINTTDSPYESGDATVVISGYAFPGSRVFTLVDGKVAQQGIANSNGSFSVILDAIARGVYTFGVYAIDNGNIKSSTFSTTFSVAGARTSALSNIHLMPTIVATPNPVDIGAVVTFSGYAIPNSTVTLETGQDKAGAGVKTITATSDSSGRWSVTQSTQGFAKDKWKVRGKSDQASGGISTGFSQYTFYSVGGAAIAPTGNNSDLNRDGKVNLIDFSILLFHWNTDGGKSNPPADINHDGKVSLTDFSIMIFNWTG